MCYLKIFMIWILLSLPLMAQAGRSIDINPIATMMERMQYVQNADGSGRFYSIKHDQEWKNHFSQKIVHWLNVWVKDNRFWGLRKDLTFELMRWVGNSLEIKYSKDFHQDTFIGFHVPSENFLSTNGSVWNENGGNVAWQTRAYQSNFWIGWNWGTPMSWCVGTNERRHIYAVDDQGVIHWNMENKEWKYNDDWDMPKEDGIGIVELNGTTLAGKKIKRVYCRNGGQNTAYLWAISEDGTMQRFVDTGGTWDQVLMVRTPPKLDLKEALKQSMRFFTPEPIGGHCWFTSETRSYIIRQEIGIDGVEIFKDREVFKLWTYSSIEAANENIGIKCAKLCGSREGGCDVFTVYGNVGPWKKVDPLDPSKEIDHSLEWRFSCWGAKSNDGKGYTVIWDTSLDETCQHSHSQAPQCRENVFKWMGEVASGIRTPCEGELHDELLGWNGMQPGFKQIPKLFFTQAELDTLRASYETALTNIYGAGNYAIDSFGDSNKYDTVDVAFSLPGVTEANYAEMANKFDGNGGAKEQIKTNTGNVGGVGAVITFSSSSTYTFYPKSSRYKRLSWLDHSDFDHCAILIDDTIECYTEGFFNEKYPAVRIMHTWRPFNHITTKYTFVKPIKSDCCWDKQGKHVPYIWVCAIRKDNSMMECFHEYAYFDSSRKCTTDSLHSQWCIDWVNAVDREDWHTWMLQYEERTLYDLKAPDWSTVDCFAAGHGPGSQLCDGTCIDNKINDGFFKCKCHPTFRGDRCKNKPDCFRHVEECSQENLQMSFCRGYEEMLTTKQYEIEHKTGMENYLSSGPPWDRTTWDTVRDANYDGTRSCDCSWAYDPIAQLTGTQRCNGAISGKWCWSGKTCSIPPDCLIPGHGPYGEGCKNGGSCFDEILNDQKFTCECVGDFTGENCEKFDPDIPSVETDQWRTFIFIPILLVVFAIFHGCWRQHKSGEGWGFIKTSKWWKKWMRFALILIFTTYDFLTDVAVQTEMTNLTKAVDEGLESDYAPIGLYSRKEVGRYTSKEYYWPEEKETYWMNDTMEIETACFRTELILMQLIDCEDVGDLIPGGADRCINDYETLRNLTLGAMNTGIYTKMKNNYNKIPAEIATDIRNQKCFYRQTCTVQDHSCPNQHNPDGCYRQWCDPKLDTLPVESSDEWYCPMKELNEGERQHIKNMEAEANDGIIKQVMAENEKGRDYLIKRMQGWQQLNMVFLILSLAVASTAFFLEWYLTSIDMLTPGKETVIGFCVMIAEDFPQFLVASFFFRTFKRFSCQHNLDPDLNTYINSGVMSMLGASKMGILHIFDSIRHRRPLKWLMLVGSWSLLGIMIVTLVDVQNSYGLENGFLIGDGYYGSLLQTFFAFMFLGTVAAMVGDGFHIVDTKWKRKFDESCWSPFLKRLLVKTLLICILIMFYVPVLGISMKKTYLPGVLVGCCITFGSVCCWRMIWRQTIRSCCIKADGKTSTLEKLAKWVLKYDCMVCFIITSAVVFIIGITGQAQHSDFYGGAIASNTGIQVFAIIGVCLILVPRVNRWGITPLLFGFNIMGMSICVVTSVIFNSMIGEYFKIYFHTHLPWSTEYSWKSNEAYEWVEQYLDHPNGLKLPEGCNEGAFGARDAEIRLWYESNSGKYPGEDDYDPCGDFDDAYDVEAWEPSAHSITAVHYIIFGFLLRRMLGKRNAKKYTVIREAINYRSMPSCKEKHKTPHFVKFEDVLLVDQIVKDVKEKNIRWARVEDFFLPLTDPENISSSREWLRLSTPKEIASLNLDGDVDVAHNLRQSISTGKANDIRI